MTNLLDIGSKNGYPAGELSNFHAHKFVFEDIECGSMEGFLQSLKFDKAHIAVEVCKLVGVSAKNRGKDRNDQWKHKQCLWWKGAEVERDSQAYQSLIDRAFIQMAVENEKFRQALLDTGDLILTHKLGRSSERETILTQQEFVQRLMKLRSLLRKGTDLTTLRKI